MLGYTEVDKDKLEKIKSFTKNGERCKISGTIELKGKNYKQIIFAKKSFGKAKLETKGYLYLSDEATVIEDKSILKELNKLSYYYEVFFDDNKGSGILAALKSEGDIHRDKNGVEEILDGLDFLINQKIFAADKVKPVVTRMPYLRGKSNRIIEELSSKIMALREQDIFFNEESLDKLYPYYEDILKTNFENVKYIATLEDCCDEVMREAEKKRKKWGVRLRSKALGSLIKVSDELSYYRRLITTYSSVLSMNTNQYMKFLNNLNKERIENRVNLIRS